MKPAVAALVCVITWPQLARADAAADQAAREAELLTTLARSVGEAAPSGKAPNQQRQKQLAREVAALRAGLAAPPDAVADQALPRAAERCALGVLYAHAGELPMAQLHLAACAQPGVGPSLRQRGDEAEAAVARALRKTSLATIDISTTPPGWLGALDAHPEALFVTPITLWLPAGAHPVRLAPSRRALEEGGAEVVRREIKAEPHRRGTLFVEAPQRPARAPGTGVVKFDEEAALEPPQTTRPPPEKHRPLIPERYRRGLGVTAEEVREAEHRGLLALQLGVGRMSPRGEGPSASATRLALHARAAFGERWFLELGVDWAHHFEPAGAGEPSEAQPGELATSGDAFGALLGARVMLWRPGGVSLLAGLRGRLEGERDARGGAALQLEGKPLPRWPLALGAAAEVENGLRVVSAYAAWELWRP